VGSYERIGDLVVRLELDAVTVSYLRRDAVLDVSARFSVGVTALVGPNGAGKSSLLRVIAGMQRASHGTVRLGSEEPCHVAGWQRAIGYLPQEPDLAGGVTVADTVALAAWLKDVGRRELRGSVHASLKLVGLEDRAAERTRTLSGGMRRRLGFATAVVHRPTVLVLDEPTSGLDPEQRASLGEVIRTLADGRIVVLSTHVLDDLRRVGGEVAVMSAGRIAFHGTLDELAAAASARLGRTLDSARPEDLDCAYLSFQEAAAL